MTTKNDDKNFILCNVAQKQLYKKRENAKNIKGNVGKSWGNFP